MYETTHLSKKFALLVYERKFSSRNIKCVDREKEKKENASERGEHQKNAEGKTQAQTSNDIQKNLLVKRFASSRINDGHHQ